MDSFNALSPIEFVFNEAAVTWTNMPAAVTEFNGTAARRKSIDCSYLRQFRIQISIGGTPGLAGSLIGLQGSADGGTNWIGADNGTANAQSTIAAALDITASTTGAITAWANLGSALTISTALFRIVGSAGDGVVDPIILHVSVQFR